MKIDDCDSVKPTKYHRVLKDGIDTIINIDPEKFVKCDPETYSPREVHAFPLSSIEQFTFDAP